jgi:hypothetical protein
VRREAFGGGWERGRGLTLFLSRGMSAWIKALSQLLGPRPIKRPADLAVDGVELRPEIGSDLTVILAGMVRACQEEARL